MATVDYEGLAFRSPVAGDVDVCLEYASVTFECVGVAAVDGWSFVDLAAFSAQADVSLVAFYGEGEVAVDGLVFTRTALESDEPVDDHLPASPDDCSGCWPCVGVSGRDVGPSSGVGRLEAERDRAA